LPIMKNEPGGKEPDLLNIYHIPVVAPNILYGIFEYQAPNKWYEICFEYSKMIIVLDSQYNERPTNELPKMRI
jgi:hypothetical protein